MDRTQYSIDLLHQFRNLDLSLSIDDFGTGYSSLAYLKSFPITKLKVDQSFCQGIPKDKDNASITSAIISLGHEMGLSVIAEGVENEAQLDFLQAQQCDEIQGYLFSKPLPADEMEKRLTERFIKI